MGLSKTQMRDEIEAGRSVLYKGKLITKVEQLATLTGTEAEKASEIADLEKRLAELKADEKSEEKPAETDAKTAKSAENKSSSAKKSEEKPADGKSEK